MAHTYLSTFIINRPFFVFPEISLNSNLPFPRIVIISPTFTCLEDLVSVLKFNNTLSCSKYSTALFLEVLARLETILSSLSDAIISVSSILLASICCKFSIESISISAEENLVSSFKFCTKKSVLLITLFLFN